MKVEQVTRTRSAVRPHEHLTAASIGRGKVSQTTWAEPRVNVITVVDLVDGGLHGERVALEEARDSANLDEFWPSPVGFGRAGAPVVLSQPAVLLSYIGILNCRCLDAREPAFDTENELSC